MQEEICRGREMAEGCSLLRLFAPRYCLAASAGCGRRFAESLALRLPSADAQQKTTFYRRKSKQSYRETKDLPFTPTLTVRQRKSAYCAAAKKAPVSASMFFHSMLKPRKMPVPMATMMTMEMKWALYRQAVRNSFLTAITTPPRARSGDAPAPRRSGVCRCERGSPRLLSGQCSGCGSRLNDTMDIKETAIMHPVSQ